MASPSVNDGWTRIADELLEALIRYPFTKRQYKVLLAVIRKTYGFGKVTDDISSSQLSELTGLAGTHCRAAVRELQKIGALAVSEGRFGKVLAVVKDYEQWGDQNSPDQNSPEGGPKQSGQPDQNSPGGRTKTVRNNKHSPINNFNTQPQQTGGSSGGGDLDFPRSMNSEEREAAIRILDQVNGSAQPLLDVCEAAIQAGQVKKSPIAFLGGLVRRYKAGTFDPTPGLHIARKRKGAAKRNCGERKEDTEAILREHEMLRQRRKEKAADQKKSRASRAPS